MIAALEWVGERARWILAIGAVCALALQDLAAFMRPALPAFVSLMYLLAMMRIDLAAVLRRSIRPARLSMILGVCFALMVLTPAMIASIADWVGLPTELKESLVYVAAGPPLGSAAALCLLLGLDAALAIELTIVGSFLTPILGPFVTSVLLGEAVPIDPFALSMRLAAMIGVGAVLSLVLRKLLGADRIANRAKAFDGIGAIAMLATIIPIFHGATELILNDADLALLVLTLVFAMNIGIQVLSYPVLHRFVDRQSGGAISLIWGNRNAALYLAALPQAPIFSLFVALYQFPMYMTPLLMGRYYQPNINRPEHNNKKLR